MRKLVALTLIAFATLLICNVAPSAQDEPDEVTEFWRSYSLDGIPLAEDEKELADTPGINPVFTQGGACWPEQGYSIRPEKTWSLGSGHRRGVSESLLSLDGAIEDAVRHAYRIEAHVQIAPKRRLDVRADAEAHALVAAIVEMLHDWYSQTAEISLYEIEARPNGCLLSAAEVKQAMPGAKLIGRQAGDPGETLVWKQMRFHTAITDYTIYSTSDNYMPQMRHKRFPIGWEVAGAAMPLDDGRVLMQAHFGEATVSATRSVNAGGLEVEAPRISSQWHPASSVLQRGRRHATGWALPAGAGAGEHAAV